MSTAQILSIYTPVPSNMIKLVLVHQVVAYIITLLEKVHLEGRKDTKMSQLAEYCSRCNGEEKLQKHQNGQLSEQIIEALLQRYARLAYIQC
jgi:hypothetical protein